jgi:hypothetical protein
MCLTRSVDNRLKQFFMGGEVRWGDTPFQGKGFRSLGQEAIYAGAIRLKRGAAYKNIGSAVTTTYLQIADRCRSDINVE